LPGGRRWGGWGNGVGRFHVSAGIFPVHCSTVFRILSSEYDDKVTLPWEMLRKYNYLKIDPAGDVSRHECGVEEFLKIFFSSGSDDPSAIKVIGKNERVKTIFWILFISMVGLVLVWIVNSAAAQLNVGLITVKNAEIFPFTSFFEIML
jgi:hypothetical protein